MRRLDSTSMTKQGNDFSSRVCAEIDRGPNETVRCTKVRDEFYRCNWWRAVKTDVKDPQSWSSENAAISHRVVKSRFLAVKCVDGSLQFRDASHGPLDDSAK